VTWKAEKTINLKKTDYIVHEQQKVYLKDFNYFLGHTQAPTSSVRLFSNKTSHPFHYENWTVAHNGVLTNYNEVARSIKNKKAFNEVDSSLIPALIQQYNYTYPDEVDAIILALSKLKGTFGLWIYSCDSGFTYLARSGSTLYGDLLTTDFSSLPFPGSTSLEEGILYQITKEGLTSIAHFRPQSPFFIL
jgi:glucosamine 6-phosphate synthetase-like amidotransferase/phosphosugar isomerase protein